MTTPSIWQHRMSAPSLKEKLTCGILSYSILWSGATLIQLAERMQPCATTITCTTKRVSSGPRLRVYIAQTTRSASPMVTTQLLFVDRSLPYLRRLPRRNLSLRRLPLLRRHLRHLVGFQKICHMAANLPLNRSKGSVYAVISLSLTAPAPWEPSSSVPTSRGARILWLRSAPSLRIR